MHKQWQFLRYLFSKKKCCSQVAIFHKLRNLYKNKKIVELASQINVFIIWVINYAIKLILELRFLIKKNNKFVRFDKAGK